MKERLMKMVKGQKGSALVISLLVMVIMTLLGISFLLMADTENKISVNERNYSITHYVAEAGVKLVKNWFDRPDSPYSYLVPASSQVDRSLRMIDHDNNPSTARVLADGTSGKPYYKQTTNDIFDKPYRGILEDALSGTEDGPDMRISESSSSSSVRAFLQSVNDVILPDFPKSHYRARITQIDIYEPPIITIGANRIRYGMGTVRVTASLFENAGTSNERKIAERVVKAVLNETPYPGPWGPLHSCRNLSWTGDFSVFWGVATAVNNADFISGGSIDVKHNSAFPWEDLLTHITGSDLNAWINSSDDSIEDPWYKAEVGGQIIGAPNTNQQPWPFDPAAVATDIDKEHSNLFQYVDKDLCPNFDYDMWKNIALSGGRNIHYYSYDPATQLFKEDGGGTPNSIEYFTNTNMGLFFFDTADGKAPHDDDADGWYDNLTPEVTISGKGWWSGGFVYLNSSNFVTLGIGSPPMRNLIPPGEPYLDGSNGQPLDGAYNDGETHLNLSYPASKTGTYNLTGTPTSTSASDREDAGSPINTEINFYGVLYTNGKFNAKGQAVYFGSVIAKEGAGEDHAIAGTPEIYFDERLIKGQWPPAELDLPRVVISSMQTDM
ncbi:MAG: PilX N-terminal domain-containing pilus assembly protein [Acidobacteriota bacterium]